MPVSSTSRELEASLYSSSPAHPSHTRQPTNRHHQSNTQRKEPEPSTARKNPLKRTASTLLTPPASTVKKRATNANPGRPAAVVSRPSLSTLSTGEQSLNSPDPDAEEVEAALRTASSMGKRPLRSALSRESSMVNVNAVRTRPLRRKSSTHTDRDISSSPIEHSSTSFMSIKGSNPSPTTGALQGVESMLLDDDEKDGKMKDHSPALPRTPQRSGYRRGVESPGSPTSEVVRRRGITTPKRKAAKNGLNKKPVLDAPIRDSPNNPFLSTGSSAGPSKRREPLEEKPMMTYVFRGQKAYYRNPAYGVPAPKKGDPSTLSPADPNFSPDMLARPKLLWPGNDGGPDDSSEEERGPIKSLRLDERGQSERALKRRRME